MFRQILIVATIVATFVIQPSGAGNSLKKLRKKLKDDSYSEPLKRTEAEAAVQFEGRHRKVANIILVHQDLVGAAVPLQILRRYLRENQLRGVTLTERKEQPIMKVWYKRASFQQIKSIDPLPNACWITLLRDPHQRALSLYLHVASKLSPASVHASAQKLGPGLRTDDDTSTALHGGPFLQSFVRQDPAVLARWPQLRYVPQWTSFADSPAAAEEVLRKHNVLVGTPDRMSEFLVMLRHRLGWPDVRSVLYADLRPQAHEKGGVLRHAHGHPAKAMDPSLLAALSLQPAMQSEVDFWQRVRLYYIEQARGFGMGRLEHEAQSLDRTLQALQKHCATHAGQVLSSDGSVAGKQPEFTATLERGRDGWGGFGAFGGFGSFGTKVDKARRVKTVHGRRQLSNEYNHHHRRRYHRRYRRHIRRLRNNTAPTAATRSASPPTATGRAATETTSSASESIGLRHRASRRLRRNGHLAQAHNASSIVQHQQQQRRRRRRLLWRGRELSGASSGDEEESFLLPFMSKSFSGERDNGLSFGGGSTPKPLESSKEPAPHEAWHVGPEPKRWAEPEPAEGRGPMENNRIGGGSTSSGSALPARTYEVQSWGRPVVDSTGGTSPLSRTKPTPSLLKSAGAGASASSSVASPVYADGDLKGIARTGRPAPRGFERCATLRSGLVTSCTPPPPGDRLEFTLQCMLHQWDACRKRPELRSSACG